VALGSTVLSCNTIDLAGEIYFDQPSSFTDMGENLCGCPTPTSDCHSRAAGLAPPAPLEAQ